MEAAAQETMEAAVQETMEAALQVSVEATLQQARPAGRGRGRAGHLLISRGVDDGILLLPVERRAPTAPARVQLIRGEGRGVSG